MYCWVCDMYVVCKYIIYCDIYVIIIYMIQGDREKGNRVLKQKCQARKNVLTSCFLEAATFSKVE